jgi:hypothetical protein
LGLQQTKGPRLTWMPSDAPRLKEPASLVALAGVDLPVGYLDYLARMPVGEGELTVEPGWIQLWAPGDVVRFNTLYDVQRNLPGFFGFGSSGGGELFAFDLRNHRRSVPVVIVPFIPMDATYATPVVSSFDALLTMLPSEAAT